jgi:hypothetical protein
VLAVPDADGVAARNLGVPEVPFQAGLLRGRPADALRGSARRNAEHREHLTRPVLFGPVLGLTPAMAVRDVPTVTKPSQTVYCDGANGLNMSRPLSLPDRSGV